MSYVLVGPRRSLSRRIDQVSVLGICIATVLLLPNIAAAQVSQYRLVRVVDAVVSNIDATLFATDINSDSESSLAVNPQNSNEIVVLGFAEGASATLGAPLWHSLDGGRTWAKQFSIPQPPGGFSIPDDQTLDWGRNNLLSITFLTDDLNILRTHFGRA